MAQIIRPKDWERSSLSTLTVVLTGLGNAAHHCVIWPAKEFFGGSGANSPVLASTSVIDAGDDIAYAHFPRVQAWQQCVIGVLSTRTKTVVAESGVFLGLSAQTSIVLQSSSVKERLSIPMLAFPTPIIWHEASNFPGLGSQVSSSDLSGLHIKTTYTSESHDAKNIMRLEYCLGKDLESFKREFAKSSWTSADAYVAQFEEADVYLRPGVIHNTHGFWGDTAVHGLLSDKALGQFPDVFSTEKGYGRIDSGLFTEWAADYPLYLIGNAGFGNFAHWMMNSLLAAFLLKEEIMRSGAMFVCPPLPVFARESLVCLGLHNRVIETEDRYIRVRDLRFPSQLSTHANMMPSHHFQGMAKALKSSVSRAPDALRIEPPRFVLLTRKGFSSGRIFANEDQFTTNLEKIGFVSIATHELSFAGKIQALSKAEIIVSQLGASLTHMMFAPAKCIIVEITTGNYHSNEYWYMASLLGFSYVRFMLEAASVNASSSAEFLFEVPLRQATEIISALVEERS